METEVKLGVYTCAEGIYYVLAWAEHYSVLTVAEPASTVVVPVGDMAQYVVFYVSYMKDEQRAILLDEENLAELFKGKKVVFVGTFDQWKAEFIDKAGVTNNKNNQALVENVVLQEGELFF